LRGIGSAEKGIPRKSKKFYGEAMKNIFWKFPQDPAEIPGYFDHIENLLALYEAGQDVKSKLLQA
jgi:hypothetical protein